MFVTFHDSKGKKILINKDFINFVAEDEHGVALVSVLGHDAPLAVQESFKKVEGVVANGSWAYGDPYEV